MLEMALVGYQARHAEITAAMNEIRKKLGPGRRPALASGGGDAPTSFRKKRALSAASRKRMAAAQRKRWAAYKKSKAAE
jgi:hypothetical protein